MSRHLAVQHPVDQYNPKAISLIVFFARHPQPLPSRLGLLRDPHLKEACRHIIHIYVQHTYIHWFIRTRIALTCLRMQTHVLVYISVYMSGFGCEHVPEVQNPLAYDYACEYIDMCARMPLSMHAHVS